LLDRTPTQLAHYCSLRIEQHVDTVTLRLAGEFDLACEERFREELDGTLDDFAGTLILDLRGLQFIDSTGLRMLVQLDAAGRSDGFDFCVVRGDGQVRRVLKESGLDGVLPIMDPHEVEPNSETPG
jgi:anti-sigma B factor antagonist